MRNATAIFLGSFALIGVVHAAALQEESTRSYPVGLSIVQTVDYSRYSKPAYDMVNQRKTIGERSRPMQILVWYPGQSANTPALTYNDYLDTVVTQDDFNLSKQEYAQKRNQLVERYAKDLKSSDAHKTLTQTMLAGLHRPPSDAQFPVVVFAPGSGGTAQDNVELCEFLAAHGYVVLATASRGAYTQGITLDLEGAEAQMLDTAFLIAYARSLPYADTNHVGIVGVSLGATAGLMTAARDARVKALVALDGAFRYYPDMTKDAPYMRPQRISAPLLFLAAADDDDTKNNTYLDDNVKGSWLGSLIFGDTYLLKMEPMKHYYFNSTVLHALPLSDFTKFKKDDVFNAYRLSERYTLEFMNAYLKDSSSSKEFLHNDPVKNGASAAWYTLQYRSGRGAAPSLEELAEMGDTQGYDHLEESYQKLKLRDPQFTPSENALHYWGHDVLDAGRTNQAIHIFKLDVALHPEDGWPYFSLGQAYEKANNPVLAARNYRLALARMPDNDDVASALKRAGAAK